jgi:ketosteroid isomerase-like protein
MSRENVEIVRRSWAAYAEGGLDAQIDFFDENISWRAIEGALDDVGEMHGREAIRRYVGDWLETFENVTAVPTELLDLHDEQVLAVVRIKGRARLSGVETELSYAIVYTLREGRIVRGREYADRATALQVLGRADG